MPIPELIVLPAAPTANLGAAVPKATALTERVNEATLALWESDGGRAAAGVWECSSGSFESSRVGFSEVCHILEGEADLETEGGATVTVRAGDLFVMPAGWRGRWHIRTRLRKVYVTVVHG